jgi:hypothetical protein
MRAFNERIAIWLSERFATMECFWAFVVLALMPVAWPSSMEVVQFISSGVLQLVALPLLAVAGVVIGRKAEARAEQDHAALTELLQDLHAKHDTAHPATPYMD